MTKKYTAKSEVSLTLCFRNGARKHVSFSSLTGGGSVYYSNDPEEQFALENHPRYGGLYKGVVLEEPKPVAASVQKAEAVAAPSIIQLPMACLDDAKDYLCDKFGLSRTKLRSRKAIMDAAAEHKIEFTGI